MRPFAFIFVAAAIAAPLPLEAETLVAARTIRAMTPIEPADLALVGEAVPGALADPAEAIGMEARVTIYAGRPIRPGDLGPAATVERNAIILLVYNANGLAIAAEGRALGRGGPGDRIRVMNLQSRNTVSGTIGPDGAVHVAFRSFQR